MGADDRRRWDERYRAQPPPSEKAVGPPSAFADLAAVLPASGAALDVACGDGRTAVWLAHRGLDVLAVDVSGEAVGRARDLASAAGVADRCQVVRGDLDEGLPAGPVVDVLVCHLFDAPHLDDELVARLGTGGLLAVAVLSEVGGRPGRFRVAPGALLARFGDRPELEVLDHREADGVARILARRK